MTYSWYRFVDQPSIVALGWSEEERNRLQSLIEKFHEEWAKTDNLIFLQFVKTLFLWILPLWLFRLI